MHKVAQILTGEQIPKRLRDIKSPPKQLCYLGDLPAILSRPILAVVGTRKITPYGEAVINKLIAPIASRGVVIVSGLALGTDAQAHKTALESGGTALAILPTSLDNILPRTNLRLARDIIETGGALMSEYQNKAKVNRANFVARNRLVSGIADAVLIIEASAGSHSGTMHTAAYAKEQSKIILAVPGPITSQASSGPNLLIKQGAVTVTEPEDILSVLGIDNHQEELFAVEGNEEEQIILGLLQNGVSTGHELQKQSKLEAAEFQQAITMLELSGRIKSLGNNQWTIV